MRVTKMKKASRAMAVAVFAAAVLFAVIRVAV